MRWNEPSPITRLALLALLWTSACATSPAPPPPPEATRLTAYEEGVPGGTGTVVAVDPSAHTATLRFDDGSTRTFPMRGDVGLTRDRIGQRVVFQVTEMIALDVEKP